MLQDKHRIYLLILIGDVQSSLNIRYLVQKLLSGGFCSSRYPFLLLLYLETLCNVLCLMNLEFSFAKIEVKKFIKYLLLCLFFGSLLQLLDL